AHPQPLNDSDRLYIGDYEIMVQLIPDEPAEEPQPAAMPLTQIRATAQAPAALPPAGSKLGTVDPLAALGDTGSGPAPAKVSGDPLAALGIDVSSIDPTMQQQLGLLVRLAVQGLVDVLKSRAEVKNSFRLPTTSIKPVENNPLKFSQSADD